MPPKPTHPVVAFLFKALKFILLPFCKIFFAPAAQRTFVKTSVLLVTISWILVTSLAAYILFYNNYVPPITHVQPVWFNYGQDIVPQPPSAIVDIGVGNSLVSKLFCSSLQLHNALCFSHYAMNKCMMYLFSYTCLHQMSILE